VRRVLPRLVFCILAFTSAASAQIAMPEGVALSPFPVLQSPAGYTTFADVEGGVWAVFLGAAPGSALYAQHVRSDGSYYPGFNANARTYANRGTLVNNLSASPDGLGGMALSWFGVNAKDSTSQVVALRYLHVLDDGSLPLGSVPDTGIVVSTIASAAIVVGDGNGGAYVVWEELKGASNPDIFAQHYDWFGNATWTPSGSPTGRPVCAVVGIQHLRALVADGSGGAYAVWADSRSGTTVPLYVSHLSSDGVDGAPWTTNGVRVTPVSAGVRIVGSSVTPAGGLWLAWRDIGIPNQFNAQQVGSDASIQWTALGAIVATVSPPRAEFVPAANGHVFVTWGGSDIRCSRLDAAGTRVWTADFAGRVLVATPSGSLVTHVATDGAGGQRVAWSMDAGGQSDVYVLDVDGAGAPEDGQLPGGELIEGDLTPEDPVAWFDNTSQSPLIEWLENGQLRVRRLLASTTGIEPPLERGPIALAPPSPNPQRGDAMLVRFTAPAGEAALRLYDLGGRLVREQHADSQGGSQSLTLGGLAALAPGVYTLRLEAAGFSRSRRVVRVR
jgi:hypothetical protein